VVDVTALDRAHHGDHRHRYFSPLEMRRIPRAATARILI
jgi:hypothetical protein